MLGSPLASTSLDTRITVKNEHNRNLWEYRRTRRFVRGAQRLVALEDVVHLGGHHEERLERHGHARAPRGAQQPVGAVDRAAEAGGDGHVVDGARVGVELELRVELECPLVGPAALGELGRRRPARPPCTHRLGE